MSKNTSTVLVNQISENFKTGEMQSLGCHVHYDGQEAAVLFLSVDDISLPLQERDVRAMLTQLSEALLEAAQSPQGLSVHLPGQP